MVDRGGRVAGGRSGVTMVVRGENTGERLRGVAAVGGGRGS